MGKTRVLDALADRATNAGLTVQLETITASGALLTRLDELLSGEESLDLLLVDDAQFLSTDAFAQLLRAAEERDRPFNLCLSLIHI